MAREGPPVSHEEIRYIQETFCSDLSALYEKMVRRGDAAGLPRIAIDIDQARLLQVLLRSLNARRVLDLGTLFGFSAAAMAQALPDDGQVVSIEAESKHAEVARANLDELGLTTKVDVRVADALEAMQDLSDDSFDLVHIDVDKQRYPQYLKQALRVLRHGGIVAADNTLAFGQVARPLPPADPNAASVSAIRAFNQALAGDPSVTSVLVPMGDGLAIGVANKKNPPRG